jgi:hypothetical protein
MGLTAAICVVAAIHVAAAVAIAGCRVSASRRLLGLTLTATVPVAGPLLAVAALRGRGAGAPGVDELDVAAPVAALRAADLERLSALPPALERLCGDADARRAALATLIERGDADSIALVRWLLEHGDPEAVVEAALALEDLTRRADVSLERARARLAADASAAAALAAGDAAADLLHRGLADVVVAEELAAEARACYRLAESGDPSLAAAVAERRAALELAVLRPAAALEALESSALPADQERDDRLAELAIDAAFAARCFERAPRAAHAG